MIVRCTRKYRRAWPTTRHGPLNKMFFNYAILNYSSKIVTYWRSQSNLEGTKELYRRSGTYIRHIKRTLRNKFEASETIAYIQKRVSVFCCLPGPCGDVTSSAQNPSRAWRLSRSGWRGCCSRNLDCRNFLNWGGFAFMSRVRQLIPCDRRWSPSKPLTPSPQPCGQPSVL